MKKYILLCILTVLLFGLTANIKNIEKATAYTSAELMVCKQNIEQNIICTGVIQKTTNNGTFAQIYINENLVSKVKENQPVRITVNALEGVELLGEIYELSDDADVVKIGGESQTMVEGLVKVKDCIEAEKLRKGYTVSAKIIVERDNALVIPFDAILYQGQEKYVYKIIENWAIKTPINIVKETSAGAVVKDEWIKQGDRVVINPDELPDKKYVRYESDWETDNVG